MEKKTVTAAEVRSWARGRGIAVGRRGPLNATAIGAFNKAHRSKAYEA